MSTSQDPGAAQYHASAAEAHASMPMNTAQLRDTTRCPACFTPLGASTCQRCALDLAHPDAVSLADVSRMAADLLDRRVGIIHRMRVDAVPATLPRQVQPSAPLPDLLTEPAPVPHTAPEPKLAPSAPPRLPQPAAELPQGSPVSGQSAGRSGVQVALLITGISLLSVFAIFFMVYAFINYGLVWRSLIIGAVTVAAFIGASILRRRSLVASSEAVAVFALVLAYLDAFAMRANGLLSLDEVEVRAYWGVVLLASGIGFIAWYRAALVRAAHLVGYAVIPAAAGLLVAAGTDTLDGPLAVYLVSIAITLAGTAQHTAWMSSPGHDRRPAVPERIILTVGSAPAIIVAAIASTALWPESSFGFALGLLGCTAVAVLQVWLHSRGAEPHDRVMAAAWGATGGLLASLTAAAYGLRSVDDLIEPQLLVVSAPLLAIALLVLWFRRAATTRLRLPLTAAASATASVAAIAAILATILVLSTLVVHLGAAITGMHREAFSAASTWSLTQWDAWVVLALVVPAGAAAAYLLGALSRHTSIVAIAGVAVLLTAPPLLPTPVLAIIAWAVLGVAGLAVRIVRPSFAAAATTATLGGLAFAWIAGWAADATWPITSALVVGAVLVARRIVSSTWGRAVLAVTASFVIVIAAIAAAELATGDASAAAPAALAAAAALTMVSAVRAIGLVDAERRAMLWVSLTTAVLALSGILATWTLGLDLPELTISGAAALTAALIAWAYASNAPVESSTSAVLIAPVAGVALSAAAVTWLDEPSVTLLAPGLVAAIAAGVALLLRTRNDASDRGGAPHRSPARWALDVGAAIALVPPFGAAATGELSEGWLAVALAAVTVALIATSADGLTGSHSPRRHLGWGALVLATGALWWALDSGGVTQPEPFVLPPAIALVIIAVLLRRRETDLGAGNTQPSAWVLLLGLLFAVVPLTLASGGASDEAIARGIATFAASAILLLAASVVIARGVTRGGLATVRIAGAAAIAGLLGVVGVTMLRSVQAISNDTVVELWLAPGVLTLMAAAVILCRTSIPAAAAESGAPRREPARIADVVGAWIFRGAVTLATVFEIAAALDDAEPVNRLSITVGALASLHVVSHLSAVLPLGTTTGWFGFVLASGTTVVGVLWADHIEQLSLPLALALLVSGSTALWRDSSARSWAHLGPAVALLLVPSLLATFVEPEIWRLVSLGAVGVVTIVAGVVLRLQAPFVVGTVVVLVHALRTFAPQLRVVYEAADWYIWAGIGGALIMAVAIRYEQRMRDLKRVVTNIAALR